jgi:thymidylate kinase
LEAGVTVVSDRGVVTSEVYQPVQAETYNGYSREYFLGLVRGLPGNQLELNHAPGLMVLLQVPAEVAMARLQNREKQDSSMFENLEFQSKIAQVYSSKELRKSYERRGTKVVDLIVPPDEKRETTKQRFKELWTEYAKR